MVRIQEETMRLTQYLLRRMLRLRHGDAAANAADDANAADATDGADTKEAGTRRGVPLCVLYMRKRSIDELMRSPQAPCALQGDASLCFAFLCTASYRFAATAWTQAASLGGVDPHYSRRLSRL